MVAIPPKLKKRQITLGAALDGFEVTSQNPTSSSVDVAAGFLNNHTVAQEYIKAAQAAGPFGSVSAPNRVRWDLVYLTELGVVAVEAGVEQAVAVPDYTGAPGNGTAFAASDAFPIAYVKVDESGGVIVDPDDITDLRAFVRMGVRGVVGELQTDNTAGPGGVLGTVWKLAPIDHQHPPNVDANNPADIAFAANPGALNIYARRDHVHQLSAALATSLATPNARSTTLHFTEYDPSTGAYPDLDHAYHWVLHRFQGRAKNDQTFWFDVDTGAPEELALWPVDAGGTGNNIGLGFSDTSDPTKAAMQNGWLYVYLIGNPSTLDVALVYSSRAPSLGPDLSHASFAGYTAYRWITCISVSDETGLGWDYPCIPMRKYDNLVLNLAPVGAGDSAHQAAPEQLKFQVSRAGAPLDLSMWVSPMSMATLINMNATVRWALGLVSQLSMRWASTGYAAGVMDAFDYIVQADAKYLNIYGLHDPDDNEVVWMEWVQLNAARQMYLDLQISNDAELNVWVIGYMEFNDIEAASINWSP